MDEFLCALKIVDLSWTWSASFTSLALTNIGVCRYVVGSTTIWSGASYIYTKDAVKILTSEERTKRGKP